MESTGAPIPPELADRVAAELSEEEELVWVGQPRLDLAIRPAYIMIPMGIFFVGFSIFWIVSAMEMPVGLMAPCGLPFIAVGLGLIASPAWLRSIAQDGIRPDESASHRLAADLVRPRHGAELHPRGPGADEAHRAAGRLGQPGVSGFRHLRAILTVGAARLHGDRQREGRRGIGAENLAGRA